MQIENVKPLEMLRALVLENRFLKAGGGPLTASLTEGHPDTRLTVVVGENAGGKSLLVKLLAVWLNEDKIEPLQVSMRYRTRSGIERAFMYGSDDDESTGSVSLHAVEGALRTGKGRKTPCWVMLDEPDTGLSDSYCAALGQHLSQFSNTLEETNCQNLLVVTHSKPLVASLFKYSTLTPHFITVGEFHEGRSMQQWLEDNREHSVEELLNLGDRNRETFLAIQAVINANKKT